MDSLDSILERTGQDYVDAFRSALQSAGRNASGQTSQSIEYKIVGSGKYYTLQILANSNIWALELGRSPTSNGGNGEVKRNILKWIDAKGIIPEGNISKEALAFLIARKIHRDGYSGTAGLLTDVITDESILNELIERIAEAEMNNVFEIIDTNIKDYYAIGS